MLKELFKKPNTNNNKIKDQIAKSLMDGYVDIKAYRYNDKNEKKLVYHDTGDNTVTNWMRQAIMQLLAGVSFSDQGRGDVINNVKAPNTTTYVKSNHSNSKNTDGCMVSDVDCQYMHDSENVNIAYYNHLDGDTKWRFPLYPTKVLLGTGKEYTSWEAFQNENEQENSAFYSKMVEWYGSGEGEETARDQFNSLIEGNIGCNTYSSTYGAQGTYAGGGERLNAITVNDPEAEDSNDIPASMAERYGVVGAVKTLYFPGLSSMEGFNEGSVNIANADEVLNPTVSDEGRLIKARLRGVGRPCFIYFNKTVDETDEVSKLDWSNQTSDVFVSKESNNKIKYLNRITFKVVMPAQKGSDINNLYYPYNGYTLRQIGLFNDALLPLKEGAQSTYANKMPCGMLLAIKNISQFTKTADEEIVFSWTLTI